MIAQQKAAVFGAGVYARDGGATLSMAPIVGEGEGATERTRYGRRVLPEHGEEQGVPRY